MMTKGTFQATAWQWQCDFCFQWLGPRALSESDLPGYEDMLAEGWSIGRVHGDCCPSCLAAGVKPSSDRWGRD